MSPFIVYASASIVTQEELHWDCPFIGSQRAVLLTAACWQRHERCKYSGGRGRNSEAENSKEEDTVKQETQIKTEEGAS